MKVFAAVAQRCCGAVRMSCVSMNVRFWPAFAVDAQKEGVPSPNPVDTPVDEDEGGAGEIERKIAAAVAMKKALNRRALINTLNEMEEEYSNSVELRRNLRVEDEICHNLDATHSEGSKSETTMPSAPGAAVSSQSEMENEDIQDIDGVEERPVFAKLQELALWAWEQRFIVSPYSTELGGRLAFDLLKTALNHGKTGFNLFSGHDYSILGVLGVLELLPEGKYLEMWGLGVT